MSSCLALTFGLALSAPEAAQASRKVPKCSDVTSANKSVERNTKYITRYQTLLELDKKYLSSAQAACTNPTTPTTPSPATCRTSQVPKGPQLENGACFQYIETYFTCEKDFNSFTLNGAEVTFRGKSGDKWQINSRAPGNFPPCPGR